MPVVNSFFFFKIRVKGGSYLCTTTVDKAREKNSPEHQKKINKYEKYMQN